MSLLLHAVRAIRDEELWGAWERGEDVPPRTYTPVPVTRESAQALAAVWACRNLIAGTIATLPWDAFRRRGERREPLRPRPVWLDLPNPEQTKVSFLEQVVESLLLDGTAFVYVVRDERAEPVELWCIHPQRVVVERDGTGAVVYRVSTDRGQVSLSSGPVGQMFHVPAYAPPGALRGMPPLEVARTMLGAGLAAQEFAARLFGQGLHPGGIIELPQGVVMSDEERARLRDDFRAQYGGVRNVGRPAILTGGAQWKPVSITPEQAQFIEARQLSKEDVATFFLVPPHMISKVDKSTSWGRGIEEQSIAFVSYTLRQWIARVEAAFTRYLLWQVPGAFVRIAVEGLLRGDVEARHRAYANARQWGWMSVNEIRALEDLPPVAGGDVLLQPVNMIVAGGTR